MWINVWVFGVSMVCVFLSMYVCWWHPCSCSYPACVTFPCNGVMKIYDECMLTVLASISSACTWIKRTGGGGKETTGKLILMPNYFWTWQPGSSLACICMCMHACVCVCVSRQCLHSSKHSPSLWAIMSTSTTDTTAWEPLLHCFASSPWATNQHIVHGSSAANLFSP